MYGVYLLLGPEKGMKEDFIKKIRDSLGTCEVNKYYAFEDYETQLFAQLSTNDLFCEKKLIILDEAQEINTKEKALPLAQYIKNPSETVTLLILSNELYIHADIMSAIQNQKEQIVKFYELFESKKSEWLKNYFLRNNLNITTDACNAIVEKIENNIQEFESVCSQIVIFVKTIPDKKTVTEEDVEKLLYHTRQETEFSLFGYIAKGNLEGALECLQSLINTNDVSSMSTVICSRLATYFRRLYSLHENLKKCTEDEAFRTKYFPADRPINMPKDKDIYKNALKRFSQRDTERILVILAESDILVKEVGTSLSQTVLEKCITDIMVYKGRHPKKVSFASL